MAAQTIKSLFRFLVTVVLMSGCQVPRHSIETDSVAVKGDDQIIEEPPLMVAQIVQVPVGAKIREVKGSCIFVRDKQVGKPLRAGQSLHHGDTFELTTDCAVTIDLPGQSQAIRLTRAQGRFFRIENPK